MATKHPHEISAKQVIAALKAVEKMIPYLRTVDKKERKKFRTLLQVPIPFMQVAASVESRSPDLRGMNRLPEERVNDALIFMREYLVVRNCLEILLENVDFSIDALRAELASDSLVVYSVAKAMGRNRKTGLHEHLRQMRVLLGRSGRKKAKVKEPAAAVETVHVAAPPADAPRKSRKPAKRGRRRATKRR